MKPRLLFLVLCLVVGCRAPRPAGTLYLPSPSPPAGISGSRTLRVRVTLSRVADLKVHGGDRVVEGEALVDRSSLRRRLIAHLNSLKDGHQHLANQMGLTDRALL